MKPIAIVNCAPPGLQQYLAQRPHNRSWQNFRDQAGNSYTELRYSLIRVQHGLCGYCEQKIPADDAQVNTSSPETPTPTATTMNLTTPT